MTAKNAPAAATSSVEPRFPASAVPTITAVRLSPGDAVDLVNISRSGVLVEGKTRFVPGTRVTIVFDGGFSPAQLKGRIVRCQVSSINGGALRYQSGIEFDQRIEASLGEQAADGSRPATPPGAPAATGRVLVNRW